MSTSVSINSVVRVKLTAYGQNVVNHQLKLLAQRGKAPKTLVVEKDGYAQFTLWALMDVFGPYIGSSHPIFDGDLIFP